MKESEHDQSACEAHLEPTLSRKMLSKVRTASSGFRYGTAAGAVVWAAFVLGLYSISTAPLPLLAGWWMGQALELGLAGAVLGAVAAQVPMRRIWAIVALAIAACIAATIVLQSLGWAPPMKVVR